MHTLLFVVCFMMYRSAFARSTERILVQSQIHAELAEAGLDTFNNQSLDVHKSSAAQERSNAAESVGSAVTQAVSVDPFRDYIECNNADRLLGTINMLCDHVFYKLVPYLTPDTVSRFPQIDKREFKERLSIAVEELLGWIDAAVPLCDALVEAFNRYDVDAIREAMLGPGLDFRRGFRKALGNLYEIYGEVV